MTFLDDILAGGWRQSVAVGAHEFNYFIQGMDDLLSRAAAEEREWLDAAEKAVPEGARAAYRTDHADTLQKLTEDFPSLLWNGATVMLFAYWEREYRDVAEWLLKSFHKRRGMTHAEPLGVRDFQGSWYEQSRKVVTQYAGIPDDPLIWSKLAALARIRNAIVHDSGRVRMTDTNGRRTVADAKLRAAIEAWSHVGVSVSAAGELRTCRQSVEAALGLIRDYMTDLLKNCERSFGGPRSSK